MRSSALAAQKNAQSARLLRPAVWARLTAVLCLSGCGFAPEPDAPTASVAPPVPVQSAGAAPIGAAASSTLASAAGPAPALQPPTAGANALPAAGANALPAAGANALPAVAGPAAMADEALDVAPDWLSQTGLYSDMTTRAPGPNVELFAPSYQLWSDAAVKTRWIMLPPGTQIDSSDMDVWKVPVGTKLWKQFDDGGRLVETRYMVKHGPTEDDWLTVAYQWNDEQTDAFVVPQGVNDVNGTSHDIPSATVCKQCHNAAPMGTLGFSALQLAHQGPGLTLDQLVAQGRLTVAPATPLALPGDAVAANALGYLHANCGGCHNDRATQNFGVTETKLVFWQSTAQLASVEQTTTYVNLVTHTHGDLTRLHHALNRMQMRDPLTQMPPLGTKLVDKQGVATVSAWVAQLQTQLSQAAAP